MEAFVKIVAYRKLYFQDGWNIFDFILLLASIAGLIVSAQNSSYSLGSTTSIFRSFRIVKIMAIIRNNRNLRVIFQTFIIALPHLLNIIGLLLLFLFIYSVLGMNILCYIKFKGEEGLSLNANF